MAIGDIVRSVLSSDHVQRSPSFFEVVKQTNAIIQLNGKIQEKLSKFCFFQDDALLTVKDTLTTFSNRMIKIVKFHRICFNFKKSKSFLGTQENDFSTLKLVYKVFNLYKNVIKIVKNHSNDEIIFDKLIFSLNGEIKKIQEAVYSSFHLLFFNKLPNSSLANYFEEGCWPVLALVLDFLTAFEKKSFAWGETCFFYDKKQRSAECKKIFDNIDNLFPLPKMFWSFLIDQNVLFPPGTRGNNEGIHNYMLRLLASSVYGNAWSLNSIANNEQNSAATIKKCFELLAHLHEKLIFIKNFIQFFTEHAAISLYLSAHSNVRERTLLLQELMRAILTVISEHLMEFKNEISLHTVILQKQDLDATIQQKIAHIEHHFSPSHEIADIKTAILKQEQDLHVSLEMLGEIKKISPSEMIVRVLNIFPAHLKQQRVFIEKLKLIHQDYEDSKLIEEAIAKDFTG